MPVDAKILCTATQGQQVCLWALVDSDQKKMETRRIRIYGTGHPIDEPNLEYIGTYQLMDGRFIGHVFEI